MNRRVKILCHCKRGFHIYPEDSVVIDSLFGNHPEDWWIKQKCKKCGSKMIIGGDIVSGKPLMGGDYIFPPEYV